MSPFRSISGKSTPPPRCPTPGLVNDTLKGGTSHTPKRPMAPTWSNYSCTLCSTVPIAFDSIVLFVISRRRTLWEGRGGVTCVRWLRQRWRHDTLPVETFVSGSVKVIPSVKTMRSSLSMNSVRVTRRSTTCPLRTRIAHSCTVICDFAYETIAWVKIVIITFYPFSKVPLWFDNYTPMVSYSRWTCPIPVKVPNTLVSALDSWTPQSNWHVKGTLRK